MYPLSWAIAFFFFFRPTAEWLNHEKPLRSIFSVFVCWENFLNKTVWLFFVLNKVATQQWLILYICFLLPKEQRSLIFLNYNPEFLCIHVFINLCLFSKTTVLIPLFISTAEHAITFNFCLYLSGSEFSLHSWLSIVKWYRSASPTAVIKEGQSEQLPA